MCGLRWFAWCSPSSRISVAFSDSLIPIGRAPEMSRQVVDEGVDLHRHQPVAGIDGIDRAGRAGRTRRSAPLRSFSDTVHVGTTAMPMSSSAARSSISAFLLTSPAAVIVITQDVIRTAPAYFLSEARSPIVVAAVSFLERHEAKRRSSALAQAHGPLKQKGLRRASRIQSAVSCRRPLPIPHICRQPSFPIRRPTGCPSHSGCRPRSGSHPPLCRVCG